MSALKRVRKVEAIIITRREFGEADRILRAFTPDIGKISVLAKGVRKSGSRKAAHIEPFTHCSLVLARGQSFWILTQAETIQNFKEINKDLHKTGLAAYLLELADHLTVEGQEDISFFHVIIEALSQIDRSKDPFIPACYYELRLLDLTGFKPDLFKCVNCGRKIIKEDQFFSTSQGGVVCPDCSSLQRNLLPVSIEALKYLRHFQRSPYEAIRSISVSALIRKEMRETLGPFIASITERRLNSPLFIQQINQLEKELKSTGLK